MTSEHIGGEVNVTAQLMFETDPPPFKGAERYFLYLLGPRGKSTAIAIRDSKVEEIKRMLKP